MKRFIVNADGTPVYEIDVLDKNGVETKIEIKAVAGSIIEAFVEKWEIGVEAEENR